MIRFLPFPLASISLLLLWLLLNQTVSPGHLLLGGVVALVGGWTLKLLDLPKGSPRRVVAIFRLAARVLIDISRSNIAVARIILGLGTRRWRSGFVEIPLELHDPYGLATLACIITATPGTLWVDFDRSSRILTIHVLDLVDEAEWVHTIKNRYERLLQEIFA
jgi:multicomponent K+:H+ antiporter subunit E